MQLSKERENEKLTVFIKGKVDTTTAPELDKYIDDSIDGITELILDLKDMEYTSSSGLRVILKTQKLMNAKGKMIVKNVSPDVMEVFEITGFTDFLTIEG